MPIGQRCWPIRRVDCEGKRKRPRPLGGPGRESKPVPAKDPGSDYVMVSVCHTVVGLGPEQDPNVSVEAMALVLHHSKASGTAKLILLGIANHEGDGGAWPAHSTLAKYANVDERNVRRAIDKLIELGELAVAVQSGGLPEMPSHKRPNRYNVLIRCPEECDRSTKHRVESTGGDSAPWGRADTPPGGRAAAPPKPSFEPSPESPSAPTRSAAPTASTPKQKKMTRAEDRAIWDETLDIRNEDYTPDEASEIYAHWCTRYSWPGCFARDMAWKGNLDGFLGGAGIELGCYDEDEADDDPWATSKSA